MPTAPMVCPGAGRTGLRRAKARAVWPAMIAMGAKMIPSVPQLTMERVAVTIAIAPAKGDGIGSSRSSSGCFSEMDGVTVFPGGFGLGPLGLAAGGGVCFGSGSVSSNQSSTRLGVDCAGGGGGVSAGMGLGVACAGALPGNRISAEQTGHSTELPAKVSSPETFWPHLGQAILMVGMLGMWRNPRGDGITIVERAKAVTCKQKSRDRAD